MSNRMSPGCLCCCPTFAEDDFTQCGLSVDSTAISVDGTDLRAPGVFGDCDLSWTQVAGAWADDDADDTMQTDDADALLIADDAHSANTMRADASVRGDTAGDKPRVVISYKDSSNYLFAELTLHATCGTLSLGKVVSGTETILETASVPDAVVDAWHALTICYDCETPDASSSGCDDILQARVVTSAGTTRVISDCSTTADASGTKAGLATGDTVAGTVKFDDFKARETNEDECPCDLVPGECLIASDNFDRANVTGDTACLWASDISPSAADISSNRLTFDGSDEFAYSSVPHPRCRVRNWHITVDVEGSDDADQALILFDVVDASNYHAARITFESGGSGNGEIAIVKVTSGTPSDVATTAVVLATGQEHSITVCAIDGVIDVTTGSTTVEDDSTMHGGADFGLGSGTITTGIFFDDLVVNRGYSDEDESCEECGDTGDGATACNGCDDTMPEFVRMSHPGWTDGTCDNCIILGGTTILTTFVSPPSTCDRNGAKSGIGTVCDGGGVADTSISLTFPATNICQVAFSFSGSAGPWTFRSTLASGETHDCSRLQDYRFTLYSSSGECTAPDEIFLLSL